MAGAGIAGAGIIFVFFWGTSYARPGAGMIFAGAGIAGAGIAGAGIAGAGTSRREDHE